jgi:hypothetical protein
VELIQREEDNFMKVESSERHEGDNGPGERDNVVSKDETFKQQKSIRAFLVQF